MYNKSVGLYSAKYPRHIPQVFAGVFALIAFAASMGMHADARRGQYMIPPPPPTPLLSVPPPPVMLPYNEAYTNFKASPMKAILTTPAAPSMVAAQIYPGTPVRSTPNFTGLSLNTAKTKGFGKPRSTYSNYGPAAAVAANTSFNAPAMNTWFDSSLSWYANHATASNYYNSLANQAPYWRPDSQAPTVRPQPLADSAADWQPPKPHHSRSKPSRRHFKRVVAYR